jgi:hypothetical protein
MSARTATDVLNDLGSVIWSPGFEPYRAGGALRDSRNPLSVVVLVLDFNAEVNINGVVDFLGNATGSYARETVEALRAISCPKDAEVLSKIIDVAESAGMTHEAVQNDLARQAPLAVGTFSDFHGRKWGGACNQISVLGSGIELSRVLAALESFVESNQPALDAALDQFRAQPS